MSGKPELDFTLDEAAREMAQDALERYEEARANRFGPGDPGYTSTQWMELWGCGKRTAQIRISTLMETGEMIKGKRALRDVTGRWKERNVYHLKEKEEP